MLIFTNHLWSIDDSCVVTKLQRADDGGGEGEQEITCDLLVLEGERRGMKGGRGEGRRRGMTKILNMKFDIIMGF